MTSTESDWLAPLRRLLGPLDCEPADGDGAFAGTLLACEVGALHVLQLRAHSQRLVRSPAADAAGEAPLVAVLQREGSGTLRQDGREATLAAGQMALLAGGQGFEASVDRPAWQTWLLVTGAGLRTMYPGTEALSASALPCQPAQVQMLACVADLAPALLAAECGQAAQLHGANAITELLASVLATCAEAGAPSQPNLATFHVARIKQHILANLNDSELSVGKVSAALKISPAHIHRVFLTERETFSEWLWSQRLLACKAALESGANAHLTVSQIAFAFGFNNSSHFSRAFRAKFGLSPTDFRERESQRRR
jgi:AraC-like DNA-binding protein